MSDSFNDNNVIKTNETVIVNTDVDSKDGQNKCPSCGATEISLNINSGKLICNYCRSEFEPQALNGMVEDLSNLNGQVIGSGADNIDETVNDIITLKCESCGAEVVIDTSSATQSRCHWCRNTLSINKQISNGSIPDVVLPFSVKKEDAKNCINTFVGKRKFFAHPKFKKEFTTNNIMGVYFPYMLVDVNSHVFLSGEGEKLVKRYKIDDNTYYDADVYNVEREFDLVIEDLTVESSSDRLNVHSDMKTNNIINSIMPFDTENCVKWNSNYLKGYSSEKRDINIDQLRNHVVNQSKDIARHAANESLSKYDRGVCWSSENMQIKGQQWNAAYLPVWLYSYQEVKGNKKAIHYVAVNGRSKETMGSVPIHFPKLFLYSSLVEVFGIWGTISADFDYDWLLSLSGFGFFLFFYFNYRNSAARHKHEKETKFKLTNLREFDQFITKRKKLSNSKIRGMNNFSVSGINSSVKFLDTLSNSGNKK